MSVHSAPRAVLTAGIGVVRCALVVRLLDEWWSYLPAGTIDDQVGDLGLSYGQSGWLLALLTLGGLVGSPVAALADRGHRRVLAVGGTLTIAVALMAFAAAAPFPVLVVAALALGGASDVMLRPLESSLAELADGRLDRLLGRQHLITWLGDFVSPALLALGAATVLGWRGVFALTAAVFVGFAFVLVAVRFPSPPSGDDEDEIAGSVRAILRHPELWWLTGAEFVLLPLDETFLGFAVARSAADGSSAAAQLLAGGVVAGGIAGSLVISRRGLDRRRVSIGCALVVIGAVTVAALPAMLAQMVGFAALGYGTAVVWAKVHHRSLTLMPHRSATVPTMVGLLSTPALVIPVAMGVVADEASITAALAGAAALSVLLAAAVLRLGGDTVAADELDELD
ncbi:MAG: MFS transporter [Ilumatobacteraceae bacterium]